MTGNETWGFSMGDVPEPENNFEDPPVGKYTFEVAREANKAQIKEAVEHAFKVSVASVNVIHVPGKMRRAGRQRGLTSSWKKAIVTLEPGNKIELFEGV